MVAPVVVEVAHEELLGFDRMHHTERHQAVRMSVGQVAKEDTVDNAEHRSRCPNAQHQRYEDGEGKDRVAGEAAQSVANILKNGFDVEAWPLLVRFFPVSLHSPECNGRLPTRFLRRHAGGDVRFSLLLEVKLQLVVYLMTRLGREQEAEARQPVLHHPCPP